MLRFKVCPRCGSSDIVWVIPQIWSLWNCNNCDYTGGVIEVDEFLQKEIQDNWKKNGGAVGECGDDVGDELSDDEFERRLDELFDEN